MWALFKHEFSTYFNHPLGYVLLGSFSLLNGLFLWVFKGSFNLFDAGFGDLNLFFELNPWLLLVLVPALSMKTFADEIKRGTLELLLTKPLSKIELIAAKYSAVLILISLALLLSFFYAQLLIPFLNETSVWDWGVFWGSFAGLFALAASFAAIGIWASTLVDSAFTAFLIALFVGLFQYYGWGELAQLFTDYNWYAAIDYMSLQHHYSTLNKGVLPLNSLFFLILHSGIFLYGTLINLQNRTQ